MKLIRITYSIALAVLVLVSSTSFIVGIHYCDKKIQNIALFTRADGCEKEKNLPPCHKHRAPACCKDGTVTHDGLSFKGGVPHIDIASAIAINIAQPPFPVSEVIPAAPVSRIEYSGYSPPLRSPNLTITLRVFLI